MALDPNVILGGSQQAPANPLQMAGQVATTQNALLQAQQNRLTLQATQLELAAKRAQGAAYAANTAPDGTVNLAAVRNALAANPDAAYGLPEATTTSQAQQGQQIGNQQQTFNLQQHRAAAVTGLLAPLAANPNATPADVARAAGGAISMGLSDPQTAVAMAQNLISSPKGISKAANDLLTASQTPEGQESQVYGTQGTQSNGQRILSGRYLPMSQGGGFQANSQTPLGISPESLASQVQIAGPDGTPKSVSLGDWLAAQGHTALTNPGMPAPVSQPAPAAPGGQMPPGAVKYPWNANGAPPAPASGASNAYVDPGDVPTGSAAAPATAPTAPTGIALPTGLAPGQAAAMAAPAAAGGEDAVNLIRSAADRPNRLALLDNMAGDLTKFNSGSGPSGMGRTLAAHINQTIGTSIDAEGVNAAQSFDKIAAQIANAQTGALGAGTDAKLMSAVHANPNSGLTNETNMTMIHQLQGNEDAINAKANAWRAANLPPGAYQGWSQSFNQAFDPRAFQMLRMTPAERQTAQQEMAKAGTLDTFKQNVNRMAQMGLLPVPGQAGGQ